ncbi:MAG: hypothetical protein ABFD10_04740 [Prolixibacteraceae bacterium]
MTIRRMLTPRYQNGSIFPNGIFLKVAKAQWNKHIIRTFRSILTTIASFEENEWAMMAGAELRWPANYFGAC